MLQLRLASPSVYHLCRSHARSIQMIYGHVAALYRPSLIQQLQAESLQTVLPLETISQNRQALKLSRRVSQVDQVEFRRRRAHDHAQSCAADIFDLRLFTKGRWFIGADVFEPHRLCAFKARRATPFIASPSRGA